MHLKAFEDITMRDRRPSMSPASKKTVGSKQQKKNIISATSLKFLVKRMIFRLSVCFSVLVVILAYSSDCLTSLPECHICLFVSLASSFRVSSRWTVVVEGQRNASGGKRTIGRERVPPKSALPGSKRAQCGSRKGTRSEPVSSEQRPSVLISTFREGRGRSLRYMYV